MKLTTNTANAPKRNISYKVRTCLLCPDIKHRQRDEDCEVPMVRCVAERQAGTAY